MTSETGVHRRGFLADVSRAGAGVLLAFKGARGGQRPRRASSPSGAKVKTVDVHAHCVVPAAMDMMRRQSGELPELVISPRFQDALVTPESHLRWMDERGIDVAALSINPFWYTAGQDLARSIVQVQNEKLSELCASHPDRFVAFATVALQFPELAAAQLEEGVRKLGLRGASVLAHVNREELSAERFHPFWERAERLATPILIHPAGVPELSGRLRGNGLLDNVIGNPLDTTIALSHLIFEGTLDRFPRLKICAAHGGGFLPSYAARSNRGCLTFPEQCSKTPVQKRPTEYLRQLYFDSLVFSPEGLRHLVAECGAGQIVMGTDYPYPWSDRPVDHILETAELSGAEKHAILGGTACRLLGISS
jgi:aminocarboxymuconate-semialdehyde decarboxylase